MQKSESTQNSSNRTRAQIRSRKCLFSNIFWKESKHPFCWMKIELTSNYHLNIVFNSLWNDVQVNLIQQDRPHYSPKWAQQLNNNWNDEITCGHLPWNMKASEKQMRFEKPATEVCSAGLDCASPKKIAAHICVVLKLYLYMLIHKIEN